MQDLPHKTVVGLMMIFTKCIPLAIGKDDIWQCPDSIGNAATQKPLTYGGNQSVHCVVTWTPSHVPQFWREPAAP